MRRSLVRLAVVAAALAIVGFGVPLAVATYAYFLHDERGELERAAHIAALSVEGDRAARQPTTTLPVVEDDSDVGLYDATGALLLGRGPQRADALVLAAAVGAPVAGDAGDDLVATIMLADGQRVVRVAAPRTEVREQAAAAGAVMAASAVVALVIARLWGLWTARRLIRPLDALVDAAVRLGDGDFSARGPVGAVTEIDAVARALDRTARRLGGLLERERRFSADASHQLRTPLAALRWELEAALRSPEPAGSAVLVRVVAAADRLQRTVEELLSLARGPVGTLPPTVVDALLDELREQWEPLLRGEGRTLVVRRAAEAPDSPAAIAAARQVLQVLIDNAVTHGAGRVRLTARETSGALALDVSDDGEGPDLPHADLFARRSDAVSGHGIGLALARSLAEAEGGRLRHTGPATFTLFLPPPSAAPVESRVPEG